MAEEAEEGSTAEGAAGVVVVASAGEEERTRHSNSSGVHRVQGCNTIKDLISTTTCRTVTFYFYNQ